MQYAVSLVVCSAVVRSTIFLAAPHLLLTQLENPSHQLEILLLVCHLFYKATSLNLPPRRNFLGFP